MSQRNSLGFASGLACLAVFSLIVVAPPPASAEDLQLFYDNFDGGQVIAPGVSGGFSGFTSLAPVQGYGGLGSGSNVMAGMFLHNPTGDNFTNTPSVPTTLRLTGLPPHSGIRLSFFLAIIDTWDGEHFDSPGGPQDLFNVSVNGVNFFRHTFTNFTFNDQSYVPPPGGLLSSLSNRFAFMPGEPYDDSLYDMGQDLARFGNIPHVGDTLQLDFVANGSNWNRPANESWGFDNVRVTLLNVVPEPGSITLLSIATLAVARRRRDNDNAKAAHVAAERQVQGFAASRRRAGVRISGFGVRARGKSAGPS